MMYRLSALIIIILITLILCINLIYCGKDVDDRNNSIVNIVKEKEKINKSVPCTCGIFLSGQLGKNNEQPKGNPVLLQETDENYLKGSTGNRFCITKCLEMVIKHLPKSDEIICAAIERDCIKEKAYLFVQNSDPKWINSKMSTGKLYCCKDNKPYKCH